MVVREMETERTMEKEGDLDVYLANVWLECSRSGEKFSIQFTRNSLKRINDVH